MTTTDTGGWSRQRTIEQERARRAWECVAAVKGSGKGYAREYSSLARGAPADIQANGLGQTLAFWKAKGFDKGSPKHGGNEEHARLFLDVSGWVSRQLGTGGDDLLQWVVATATTNDYRRATVEAIAFLGWVKRFAEAELGEA